MKCYKVIKTMKYTEVVYIKANSKSEAEDLSGEYDGERNHDDTWYDSNAVEVTKDEYEEEG